jgi:hypothetical protein
MKGDAKQMPANLPQRFAENTMCCIGRASAGMAIDCVVVATVSIQNAAERTGKVSGTVSEGVPDTFFQLSF